MKSIEKEIRNRFCVAFQSHLWDTTPKEEIREVVDSLWKESVINLRYPIVGHIVEHLKGVL